MNKAQWFVLAGIFFILSLIFYSTAIFYDKYQWMFGDIALSEPEGPSEISVIIAEAFMINDNIYRMGSGFALAFALGFSICGSLEPKKK